MSLKSSPFAHLLDSIVHHLESFYFDNVEIGSILAA